MIAAQADTTPVRRDDAGLYPMTDDMGESTLQFAIVHFLLPLLRAFYDAQERDALVGGNLFFYYRRGDPRAKLAPDVYVLDDFALPPGVNIPSWKVWERGGKVPALALEIVSRDVYKDYAPEEIIDRYEALGVPDLVRYDPLVPLRPRHPRRRLTHYARSEAGRLIEQPAPEAGDRIYLPRPGLWLVHDESQKRLRVALGTPKQVLSFLPTEAERAQAEAERAQAEAERAEQALEEVARLQEELARLKAQRPE